MRIGLLCSIIILVSLSSATSFDKPRYKRTVDLGPSRYTPGNRGKVSCYYFAGFMVKEVDLGEKGADKLAIVPIPKGVVPRCTRARSKDEKVVNPDDWSGYFKGVKNNLVFFDADDGVNGGMGFAVYDSNTGRKIFEDVALGPLDFPEAQGSQVSIKYTRVLDSQCNVPQDESACWAKITKAIGLDNAAIPDCKKGYEQSAQELAKGRCQAQKTETTQCLDRELPLARSQTKDANSIIAYAVEVVLDQQPTTKPVSGDLRCWPSD